MRTVLYLRSGEMTLFNALPKSIQAEWQGKVVEESIDAYESEDQLATKMNGAPFVNDERYKAWAAKHSSGVQTSDSLLSDFPGDLFPSFFECIGACGLCAMIEMALGNGKLDDEAMNGVAALSVLRHQILTKNAVAA